ncbi:BatD family protein [Marinomonas sp. A79]|uniref:BatD family protein n=1 Tax=Marinomonas vulgaris TaxID=2823372 RepID=A0ABS5HC32_9GAMM|nr:BatD family protein [Marinomonas vulgaris]MBR7889195.1 BatD family protein [Marinomonas vulgaris]
MVIKHDLPSFKANDARYRVYLASVMLLLCLLFSNALFADTVSASLNKTVSVENEVVQLTLRADFSDTGNGPDLSPLERDFTILGKSQNSQFSFNLGTTTALNFWVVSLMPKSVGTFEIPPIKIGDHASEPIRLVIKNSPQLLDANGNPPVMIKTDVSEIEPYLQQETIISVQLFTSVALQNANRSVPEHPDLVVERLSDDQMNYQTVNGTQYQVITREYLAFPQRSGLLTLPPQSIQAMVNTSTGRRMIKVQSEPLNIQVLPIPASYSGTAWLPSQGVKISTALDKTNDSPRVGDTLIWTIEVQAKGALPEQIPPIDFNSTRAYKLYPKNPEFDTQKSADGVVGRQLIVIEVVPTQEGPLTLPDITINYWDTEQRALQTVIATTPTINIAPLPTASNPTKTPISDPLPAQTRSVAPISLAKKPSPSSATTAQTGTESARRNAPDNDAFPINTEQGDTSFSVRSYLIAGLLVLTTVMLALWVWIWLKKRQPSPEAELNVPTLQEFAALNTVDEFSAFDALISCCRQNDLSSLRPSLLEWARHRWGDNEIRSVDDIKRLTSVQVTQLLMEAELMMYSSNPSNEWQGEPLADALEEYTSGYAKPSQASQLKTLYPNF